MNIRNKAVVVIPSDVVARKLVGSGAFDTIMNRIDVVFMVSKSVTINLPRESFKVELFLQSSSILIKLDQMFWLHSLYVYWRKHSIKPENTFKVRKTLSLKQHRLHKLLVLPIISSIVDKIDKWYFSHDENVLSTLKIIQPDLIITPGSAMDTYSNIVLRTADKLGIPTLMVISHWDYFSKKGLLRFQPYKIYVWGEDMKNSASKVNEIPEGILSVVGAPQFQKYLSGMPSKKIAKSDLALNINIHWILFSGSSIPYDEISVVNELSECLFRLNRYDIGIIYRPHPRAWPRKIKQKINLEDLSNVVVDNSQKEFSQSESHYQKLISASEGIISPYSTMILEGALSGLPALCISFDDDLNDNFFLNPIEIEHIKPLLERDWIFPCSRREDLEPVFRKFISKIFDPQFKNIVKNQIRSTIYFDDDIFSDRLCNHIEQDFFVTRRVVS